MMGATNPRKAAPGTIRGDLGILFTENLVHGSDSLESADREIGIFFPNSVTNPTGRDSGTLRPLAGARRNVAHRRDVIAEADEEAEFHGANQSARARA